MNKYLSIIILILVSATAQASPLCTKFEKHIDINLRSIAKLDFDNNVGVEGKIEQTNLWQQISLNVNLMAQNKCPPISEPITESDYSNASIACAISKSKAADRRIETPECKIENWIKGKK